MHEPGLAALYYFFAVPFDALNAIGAVAVSPPLALPALITHFFRVDAFVPQVPLPILPVRTLNFVDGSTPLAVMVTGVAVSMSHWLWPAATARHSTKNTWSCALKPEPVTLTTLPFVSPTAGLTTSLGVVTEAAGMVPKAPVARIAAARLHCVRRVDIYALLLRVLS
jgi:hypothetical protein